MKRNEINLQSDDSACFVFTGWRLGRRHVTIFSAGTSNETLKRKVISDSTKLELVHWLRGETSVSLEERFVIIHLVRIDSNHILRKTKAYSLNV